MQLCFFWEISAFGFCEYEDPEATLRCMRLLNDWEIADKKLVVSLDMFIVIPQHMKYVWGYIVHVILFIHPYFCLSVRLPTCLCKHI